MLAAPINVSRFASWIAVSKKREMLENTHRTDDIAINHVPRRGSDDQNAGLVVKLVLWINANRQNSLSIAKVWFKR